MPKPLAFEVDSVNQHRVNPIRISAGGATVDFSDLSFDASEDRSHPNRMPFKGTLLVLNQPSNQPPHGSEGHCIEVPTDVARRRLRDLIGMGVNYEPDLEGHAPRRKVGVITSASIEGNKVKVKGLIWKKDFPESEDDLHANGSLGMSMELGDVFVQERNDPVWRLVDFRFTGATILKKDNAAYWKTSLAASSDRIMQQTLEAASAALGVSQTEGGTAMAGEKDRDAKSQGQLLAQAISASVGPALEKGLAAGFEKLTATLQASQDAMGKLTKAFEAMVAKSEESTASILASIEAIAGGEVHADASADSSNDPSMAAADADSTADSTNDSTADSTNDDDASMDSAADPSIDTAPNEPGNQNPDASEHRKENARGGSNQLKAAARRKAAARVTNIAAAAEIKTLRARAEKAEVQLAKVSKKVDTIEAHNERLAARLERKSLSPELSNLLAKDGYNINEVLAAAASGQKMSVTAVDAAITRSALNLSPTDRIRFKNELLAAGVMDEGVVQRHVG